jgi:PBSX family phage portal protein
MAERLVRMADDNEGIETPVEDEFVVPTIESIHTLSKSEVDNGVYSDAFARQGDFVKSLSGTTPNFKRKVTNELKKYNRSADGKTESKRIDDSQEVTGYDAFGVVTPPHSLEGLASVYAEMSDVHYAAVNAKADNIVGLGYSLVETRKTKRLLESLDGNEKKLKKVRKDLDTHREELYELIEDLNEEQSFVEILRNVWLDYEVMGNGYLEVGRKLDGTIAYLGHVPAQTVRVRRQRDGFVQISANKAQFFRNFGDKVSNPIGDGKPNELIHIMRYSPVNSYYGVPDIIAAQEAIAGNKFAANFNIEYFENKAVPRHLITLKGANLGATAQADLLTFFETGLKGQNHRSLFIPLPADDGINKVEFKIEAIDAKVQEASWVNYTKANKASILTVHRVPITKVDVASSASLAIARDADKTFKEQVCGPAQQMLGKKINRIVRELTDALELKFNEMTLTDEDTQSKIDERRIKTGTETANEQRARRGLPTIKGGDELVDLNAKDKIAQASAEAATERARDSERSAGATDSAGEARSPKGDGRTTA